MKPGHNRVVVRHARVRLLRQAAGEDDTTHLRCVDCGWVFPIDCVDEDERCTECDGPLEVTQ